MLKKMMCKIAGCIIAGVSSSISAAKNSPVLQSCHVSLLLCSKQISFGDDPQMQLIYQGDSKRQKVKAFLPQLNSTWERY